MSKVIDLNIVDSLILPVPEFLCRMVQRSEKQARFVVEARRQLHNIIFGADKRLLLIVGPCSIHDVKASLEYAEKLAALARTVEDRLLLVMRVYFEKPRTTVGWKGLIMDPNLDGSNDIPSGLKLARQFLSDIIDLELPTATELLDPITPQYIADFICWSSIGARTSESQTHRQMASGLSMPLGFKNSISGNVQAAVNAIKAAGQQQTFLGINHQGMATAVTTSGNPDCHIILRGGSSGPNYDSAQVASAEALLKKYDLKPAIMIDCSHGNSGKDYTQQPMVMRDVLKQIMDGNTSIIGAMLESNLVAGTQKFPQLRKDLCYGQSITDPCIDWESTEALVHEIYAGQASRFAEASSR